MPTYSNQAIRDAALNGQRVTAMLNVGKPCGVQGYVVAVDFTDILLVMLVDNNVPLEDPILVMLSRSAVALLVFHNESTFGTEPQPVQDFVNDVQTIRESE